MKSFVLFVLVFFCHMSFAQSQEDLSIEAKLFLPTHVKSTLIPTDKLKVYLLPFPDDTAKGGKQIVITAKKIKENIYEFKLPARNFWHVGFSIGKYSYQMVCIDNRSRDATEFYDFYILLEDIKRDFTKDLLLPPCLPRIIKDDE